MFGEDYQVFLSDGRELGQVWVLGHGEGGKPGVRRTGNATSITSFPERSQVELGRSGCFLSARAENFYLSLFAVVRVVSFCFV